MSQAGGARREGVRAGSPGTSVLLGQAAQGGQMRRGLMIVAAAALPGSASPAVPFRFGHVALYSPTLVSVGMRVPVAAGCSYELVAR